MTQAKTGKASHSSQIARTLVLAQVPADSSCFNQIDPTGDLPGAPKRAHYDVSTPIGPFQPQRQVQPLRPFLKSMRSIRSASKTVGTHIVD